MITANNKKMIKKLADDMFYYGVAIYKTENSGKIKYVTPMGKEGIKIQRKVAQLNLYKKELDKQNK